MASTSPIRQVVGRQAGPSVSSFDDADRITNTGYTYETFGRTIAVPGADAHGIGCFASFTGTTQPTYYADDMVASEVQAARR